MDRRKDCIIKRLALFPEIPGLPSAVRTVAAEYGQECAVLEPSDIQLPVSGIRAAFFIISVPEPGFPLLYKKSTDIKRPVRQAAGTEMQAAAICFFRVSQLAYVSPDHRIVPYFWLPA